MKRTLKGRQKPLIKLLFQVVLIQQDLKKNTRICSPNTAGKQAINAFAFCKGGYIMRKVSATVIYKDNAIYNLTVNHKGVLIPLVAYDETSVKHPYEKRTFQTMYKSVLNILKNNNFYYQFCFTNTLHFYIYFSF